LAESPFELATEVQDFLFASEEDEDTARWKAPMDLTALEEE
jgi:hypothetical protein